MARPTNDFLAGVIEGFYGQPWTHAERLELLEWMERWKLNTYFYAPKDNLKHRALWRETYVVAEAESLRELIKACGQRHVRFIYALSPGLDIRYAQLEEMAHLQKRFQQLLDLGCENFSLLFDDIPDRIDADDLTQFGSLASAQCHVANTTFRWLREKCPDARFLFCPTPYCGRMAKNKLGGENYLAIVGRELLPEIDVFWTGPEIISREISVEHIRELQTLLRRKPVIWDNLHANDYDARRFFCGPYAGRPTELRAEVNGLLINPNCEFVLNYVPLRTFAQFLHEDGFFDARKSYLAAMEEWLPQFATVGAPIALDDLIFFGDCYYLPYADGPEAGAFYERAKNLLATNPLEWGERAADFLQRSGRLKEFCQSVAQLKQRKLFYALSRRVWELREELDLLERYVVMKMENKNQIVPCQSDFHLPETYRGGFVSRLELLLVQQFDGTFVPQETFPTTSPR